MRLLKSGESPVVICGAGAAGMAAAIASARQNIPTVLVESASRCGGTVARSLIHTIAGLYDSEGQPLNSGLSLELEERLRKADGSVQQRRMGGVFVLNVDPACYQEVTQQWMQCKTELIQLTDSRVVSAETSGEQLQRITIQTHDEKFTVDPRAVVDTTGTGQLVEQFAPHLVEDDAERAAGGLVVRLRGVPPGTLAFPKGIGLVRDLRSAAQRGELPTTCEHAWLDSGIAEDEVYLKLFVPLTENWKASEVLQAISETARDTAEKVVGFLRRFPAFTEATVEEIGELGIRDGGRIQGEYYLTADDVRTGKTFPDAVCRAAWPIEYWHPEQGIQLESLPSGVNYEIPLRSLRVRGWRNVFMAGKCLSADHLAQASARVVGTCWAMGEGVGKAAAACESEVTSHES